MVNANKRPHRLKVWRNRALELLLFVVLVTGIRAWQHRDMPEGSAPLLQGALLNGSAYALPARPAQPLLVHFWATWCAICSSEQDSIAAIVRDHPNTITIAMQSGSTREVTKYLTEHHLHYPVVNDPEGKLSNEWGVHAVPASFIINTNGQVRFIEVGYTTGWGLRFRLWLAGFLA